MIWKKIGVIFLIFFLVITSVWFYLKFFKKTETVKLELETLEEAPYSSNIIKDVSYSTIDADGNEYIITAVQGEIDYSDPNIIFLDTVNALIKLKNSEKITITSEYGKYNSQNFDTIFSKNVIINYLDNKLTGEYLDFSLERNLMVISKNVVYTTSKNILKADVIEINITTKDSKIFMYEKEKKVNIKNRN